MCGGFPTQPRLSQEASEDAPHPFPLTAAARVPHVPAALREPEEAPADVNGPHAEELPVEAHAFPADAVLAAVAL